jgi:GNAT superfamily N-acetyltransferase
MRASELGTSVRPALLTDAARIVALCAQLGYDVTLAHVEHELRTMRNDHTVLVAVVPRVGVVGWVGVCERYTLTSSRRADIEGLVVEDEYRGNGIGEMLLTFAQTWARARGCRQMRLLSNVVRKRAHAFYLRFGYEVLKTEYVFQRNL